MPPVIRRLMRQSPAVIAVIAAMAVSCDDGSPRQEATSVRLDSALEGELLRNAGFEQPGSPTPQDWFQEIEKTGRKGTVSQDQGRVHSGNFSLRLQPNQQNASDPPLAVAQMVPAAALRGRKVELSGHLYAEGGAVGALGILSVVGGRPTNLAFVSQPGGSARWVRHSKVYDVPDDPSVQLVVTCFVSGQAGAAWTDDVSLVVHRETPADAQAAVPATPLKATVEVLADTVLRRIPRTLYGANVEWIWNANSMWLEKERRPHPEVVRLAHEMGISLIRYPGGHYSDFYHWKDGIGPYEKRQAVPHAAGKEDKSPIYFGTNEALDFARRIDAQLMITVNAGTGTAQEAADWISYINGAEQQVRYCEVGNELYINDRSPISKAITIDPATYVQRFREFAQAIRAVDPRIMIGAIGGENQGRYAVVSYADWNRTLLQGAGDQIDFLAVHNAYAPLVLGDEDQDVRTVYRAMLAAPVLTARNLDTVSRQIDQYAPPARASRIRMAVTEWGPVFAFHARSRYADHPKTLGSALYAASMLKVLIESERTDIANAFLLNDVSVLGWIGSRNDRFPPDPDWAPTARYFAFQFYTRHFGEQLVKSATNGPTYDSQAVGLVDAVHAVPYLDIISSLSANGRELYIIGINKHYDSPVEAAIDLRGFRPAGGGTAWTLNGTAIDANTGTVPLQVPGIGWAEQTQDQPNTRFSRGGSNEIKVVSTDLTLLGPTFTYSFPPHSVTSLALQRAPRDD